MKLIHCLLIISLFLTEQPITGQTLGCTDTQAENFDPSATENDGSCTYINTTVDTDESNLLDATLEETSGLILWNNLLWTHNDDTDVNLYGLDPTNGEIIETITLSGQTNTDWEEISQDDAYIYIGDFGNNVNGNRTDLHILKVSKTSLINNAPVVERIDFTYEDQTDFEDQGGQNTDYDCEAMIITNDSIYLFTKQWISLGTAIYKLPNTPGVHEATLENTLDVNGLITGSTVISNEGLIVLSGYSEFLEPFAYCLYDYPEDDIFNGNKRKLMINLPQHQVEGITTQDGLTYYISNETFAPLSINAQIHRLDLSAYLQNYLTIDDWDHSKTIKVFPNPATTTLKVASKLPIHQMPYIITDSLGKQVLMGILTSLEDVINVSNLSSGMYTISFDTIERSSFNILKD